jgi:hypothetical protein
VDQRLRLNLEETHGQIARGVVHRFLMVVMPRDPAGEQRFIASETSRDAIEGGGPPFLCIYTGGFGPGCGHLNLGSSTDWNDIEEFSVGACKVVCKHLADTEVVR